MDSWTAFLIAGVIALAVIFIIAIKKKKSNK